MISKKLFPTIFIFTTFVFLSCNKEGCTEPHADNYSEKAKMDDGSCSYADGAYAYAENKMISVSVGAAEMYGPVTEADYQLKNGSYTIKAFTASGGWNTYFIESELFLNADLKNGDMISMSAAAYGMTGGNTAYMNSDGNLDFDFIMLN